MIDAEQSLAMDLAECLRLAILTINAMSKEHEAEIDNLKRILRNTLDQVDPSRFHKECIPGVKRDWYIEAQEVLGKHP